jgi:hypothetical protein
LVDLESIIITVRKIGRGGPCVGRSAGITGDDVHRSEIFGGTLLQRDGDRLIPILVSAVFAKGGKSVELTESSPPAHSNVVGSPACTEAGTCVKAMLSWAWASATKHEAPRRRLVAKYIMFAEVEEGTDTK